MNDVAVKKNALKLFWLCWIAYTASYITRLNLSTAMPAMIAKGLFDTSSGGAIGTGFLVCYGLGQLVNGFLGDKISPKAMIGTGIIASGAMNILMGIADSTVFLGLFWCMNGFFCSMLWAPIIRCFSEYLPHDERMKAGIKISTTIPAGGICAYFLGSIVLNFFDYRALFFISGSIGILAGAIWLINMTKMKQYLNAFHNFECNQNSSLPSESALPKQNFIKLIFTTGVVFAVFCVLFNGVLKDGITLWIPTLLTDVFFVSPSRASLISIVLPIVNLLGAFVANYLNKRFFKNELTTVAAMFFVSMLSVIGLYFLGSRSVIAAAVLISICTSAMLGANTMLLTFIPLNFSKIGRSASMTGFLDACSYLASAVASVTIGLITVSHGWSVTILTWAAVALCGLLIAVIGIPVWKKHREP